jgi:MarR family transcriptional regulator for hemolysin
VSESATQPLGVQLTRTAKVVSRAFDDALSEVGGSVPQWLVLLSLATGRPQIQRELAAAVGIEGPTLTHHLDRMERAGLVTRTRDPENRRVQRVVMTGEGEARFHALRSAVVAFDARLRDGLADADVDRLAALLGHLRANVTETETETETEEVLS